MIPATHEIKAFFHCKQCMAELPAGMSPAEWGRYECGWTKQGFQMWCLRHNCNVVHVDFEGKKHPANTGRMLDS